jgi:hypothetical protein
VFIVLGLTFKVLSEAHQSNLEDGRTLNVSTPRCRIGTMSVNRVLLVVNRVLLGG